MKASPAKLRQMVARDVARGVFTTTTAAVLCLISPHQITRCCETGELESYRIPGGGTGKKACPRRITRDSLVAFILAQPGMPMPPELAGEAKVPA